MTKIFHLIYCDEYEADAFFTEKGDLIHAWNNSDAMWSREYMDPLLRALGFEIERVDDPILVQKLLDWFGY